MSDGEVVARPGESWLDHIEHTIFKGTSATFHGSVASGYNDEGERETVNNPVPAVGLYLSRRGRAYEHTIRRLLYEWGPVKVSLSINVNMLLPSGETEPVSQHFSSFLLPIIDSEAIHPTLHFFRETIVEDVDNFLNNGSNWKIINIVDSTLHIRKLEPNAMVRGGPKKGGWRQAGRFIPLPAWVGHKRGALLNPPNKDEYCFHYCLMYYLDLKAKREPHRQKNGDLAAPHIEYKMQDSRIKYPDDVVWPLHPRHVDAVEKLNWDTHHLAINVLEAGTTADEGYHYVRPSSRSQHVDANVVWLVMAHNTHDGSSHYCVVRPDRLNVAFACGRHNRNHYGGAESYNLMCERCLMGFNGQERYDQHVALKTCYEHPPMSQSYPPLGENYQYFKSFNKKQEVDFFIVGDFECFLRPTDGVNRVLSRHVPSQFGFRIISTFNNYTKYYHYIAPDDVDLNDEVSHVGLKFTEMLLQAQDECIEILRCEEYNHHHPKLTDEQEKEFQHATRCYLCQLPFEGAHHPMWDVHRVKARKLSQGQQRRAMEVNKCSEEEVLRHYEEERQREHDANPPQTKVRDHDHRKPPYEHYRGAAHQSCNLNFRRGWRYSKRCNDWGPTKEWKIPVLFHNLRHYDSHLIIRNLGGDLAKQGLHSDGAYIIPQEGESVMSFGFAHLQFIDSLSFLGCSLEKAVVGLRSLWSENDAESIATTFPDLVDAFSADRHDENKLPLVLPSEQRFLLLLQKGEFPYEWMTGTDKLNATSLPPIDQFHSEVRGGTISQQEYDHAQLVWGEFECRTMADYQSLYLACDVNLLAACLRQFRKTALAMYKLEPLKYISAPSLSADASMHFKPPVLNRITGLWEPFMLELFPDTEDGRRGYLFCEANKRGGITSVAGRHSKAEVVNGENVEIAYIDATNLYGWAMSEPLPTGGMRWWSAEQVDELNGCDDLAKQLLSMDTTGDRGYWVTVDIHIPPHLHELTQDYPLFPVGRTVSLEETSPHYQDMLRDIYAHDEYHRSGGQVKRPILHHDHNTRKLICDLNDKLGYSVLVRYLQLGLQMGVQVKNVTAVLEYRQERWMADYIAANTAWRNKSKDKASRDVPKLMNNAVYGKFLQDDRKHRDCQPVFDDLSLSKQLRHPYTDKVSIIRSGHHKLALVEKRKKTVLLNKPLLCGITILDTSRIRMYSMMYKTLKPLFGTSVRMLMTDTDSFILEFRHKIDAVFQTWEEHMVAARCSDEINMKEYADNHPAKQLMVSQGLDPNARDGVLGVYKNESPQDPIVEFVGLKAKLYAYLTQNGKHEMRAKGVRTNVLKANHNFHSYLACLRATEEYIVEKYRITGIHSKQQEIRTDYITKQTLSPLDSKRFMLDACRTLPYGHKDILHFLEETGVVDHTSLQWEGSNSSQLSPVVCGSLDPDHGSGKRQHEEVESIMSTKRRRV